MTDTPNLSERLQHLLDAERAALLAGDFDRIAELMEEKQVFVKELEDNPIRNEELAPLRDGLRRNQELFDQALAGIRNVAARLGDLNRVRRSMDTYDAQGRRHTIDTRDSKKLERRA